MLLNGLINLHYVNMYLGIYISYTLRDFTISPIKRHVCLTIALPQQSQDFGSSYVTQCVMSIVTYDVCRVVCAVRHSAVCRVPQVSLETPQFLSSMGPSVDGVTITRDWRQQMAKMGQSTRGYVHQHVQCCACVVLCVVLH